MGISARRTKSLVSPLTTVGGRGEGGRRGGEAGEEDAGKMECLLEAKLAVLEEAWNLARKVNWGDGRL